MPPRAWISYANSWARAKKYSSTQKYYDIGETVKRAVRVAAGSGVQLLTVHGSSQVMRAAIEGRGDATTKLLAVTVLTSFDQQDLADMGYECAISDLVALRVRKAMEAGMDGLVCSPWTPRRSARAPVPTRFWSRRGYARAGRRKAIKNASPRPPRPSEMARTTSSWAAKSPAPRSRRGSRTRATGDRLRRAANSAAAGF